jgi:two-component system, LytTR family, response regulator
MRVLVVDDEPLARRGLRREVERLPGHTCVGECSGRDDAVRGIAELRPDVVLLDVQLGAVTGFEVIERIGVEAMPLVVFVTAYDRHALRAFEVNAVDYVLKPVDPIRLREALDRAARQLALEQGPSLAVRLEQLLASRAVTAEPQTTAAPVERLAVHDGDRRIFVEVNAIDWIEADGNSVRLHVGARTHALRTTMGGLERRLTSPPGRSPAFVRIRRSVLVNVRAITAVEPYGKGMYTLTLRSGARVLSSRYHQEGLRALLNSES